MPKRTRKSPEKPRFPLVPITTEWRQKLVDKLDEKRGNRTELSAAIGRSMTSITNLCRFDPSHPEYVAASTLVIPICRFYGWTVPQVARNERLQELIDLANTLSDDDLEFLVAAARRFQKKD